MKFISEVPSLEYIKTSEYCEVPSRHLFQIYSKDDLINRDTIIEGLHNRSIYPGVHYIDNRTYSMFRQHEDFCKRATFYSKRIISLPLHLNLSEQDIIRICNSLREITTKTL